MREWSAGRLISAWDAVEGWRNMALFLATATPTVVSVWALATILQDMNDIDFQKSFSPGLSKVSTFSMLLYARLFQAFCCVLLLGECLMTTYTPFGRPVNYEHSFLASLRVPRMMVTSCLLCVATIIDCKGFIEALAKGLIADDNQLIDTIFVSRLLLFLTAIVALAIRPCFRGSVPTHDEVVKAYEDPKSWLSHRWHDDEEDAANTLHARIRGAMLFLTPLYALGLSGYTFVQCFLRDRSEEGALAAFDDARVALTGRLDAGTWLFEAQLLSQAGQLLLAILLSIKMILRAIYGERQVLHTAEVLMLYYVGSAAAVDDQLVALLVTRGTPVEVVQYPVFALLALPFLSYMCTDVKCMFWEPLRDKVWPGVRAFLSKNCCSGSGKGYRFVQCLALSSGVLSLVLLALAFQLPILSIEPGPGVIVSSLRSTYNDIDEKYDGVVGTIVDIVKNFNPCAKPDQVTSKIVSGIKGLTVNITVPSIPDLLETNPIDLAKCYNPSVHFTKAPDMDLGTMLEKLGFSEDEEEDRKAQCDELNKEGEDLVLKAKTMFESGGSLDLTKMSEAPEKAFGIVASGFTSFDEFEPDNDALATCASMVCSMAAVAQMAAKAISMIPFAQWGGQAAEIAAQVAEELRKLGMIFTKIAKVLLRLRSKVWKVKNTFDTISEKFTQLTNAANILKPKARSLRPGKDFVLGAVPVVVIGLFCAFTGFWRRKGLGTQLQKTKLGLIFLTFTAVNLGLFVGSFVAVSTLRHMFTAFPESIITISIEKEDGYYLMQLSLLMAAFGSMFMGVYTITEEEVAMWARFPRATLSCCGLCRCCAETDLPGAGAGAACGGAAAADRGSSSARCISGTGTLREQAEMGTELAARFPAVRGGLLGGALDMGPHDQDHDHLEALHPDDFAPDGASDISGEGPYTGERLWTVGTWLSTSVFAIAILWVTVTSWTPPPVYKLVGAGRCVDQLGQDIESDWKQAVVRANGAASHCESSCASTSGCLGYMSRTRGRKLADAHCSLVMDSDEIDSIEHRYDLTSQESLSCWVKEDHSGDSHLMRFSAQHTGDALNTVRALMSSMGSTKQVQQTKDEIDNLDCGPVGLLVKGAMEIADTGLLDIDSFSSNFKKVTSTASNFLDKFSRAGRQVGQKMKNLFEPFNLQSPEEGGYKFLEFVLLFAPPLFVVYLLVMGNIVAIANNPLRQETLSLIFSLIVPVVAFGIMTIVGMFAFFGLMDGLNLYFWDIKVSMTKTMQGALLCNGLALLAAAFLQCSKVLPVAD